MRLWIIPLMLIFVALAQFNRVSMSVAGDEMIRTGLFESTQMGFVYSAFLLLYTIFMVPGGWLIDWLGPRASWVLVGFGSAAGLALTGAAGYVFAGGGALLASLIVIRALMGASNSPLHPCAARLVANWAPPYAVALLNGMINAAAVVGIASQYLVFGWLMDTNGWGGAFLLMSFVTACVAIAWTLTGADRPRDLKLNDLPRDDTPRPRASEIVAETLRLLRNRSLVCLTLSYGMLNYFEYLLFYWTLTYFREELKLAPEESRFYSTVLLLAMGAGMAGGGVVSDVAAAWLGQRRARAAVPVGGLLLGALFILLGASAHDHRLVLLCFAIAAAAAGSGEGTFWTASVHVGGARGGTAAAILNTGGNAFGMIAPVMTPFVAEQYGWGAALGLASGVCVVGAALWLGVQIDRPAIESLLPEEVLE